MVMPYNEIVNNIPVRKRRSNILSSAASAKIKLNESFCYEPYFSFKYFPRSLHKPFCRQVAACQDGWSPLDTRSKIIEV